MKLKHAAIVATVIVLVGGFALISPLFLHALKGKPQQGVMFAFIISDSKNAVEESRSISGVLGKRNLKASVFIPGEIAERHPEIISFFGDKADIGSQTYSNINLTTITDYSLKLQEVDRGKRAVDTAGSLNSMLFHAPSGATDQDIYSLLSRSGIFADFSYENQFNVYRNGQFEKYQAVTFMARNYSPNFFSTVSRISGPVIIYFQGDYPANDLETIISTLERQKVKFLTASDLAGFPLTIRADNP